MPVIRLCKTCGEQTWWRVYNTCCNRECEWFPRSMPGSFSSSASSTEAGGHDSSTVVVEWLDPPPPHTEWRDPPSKRKRWPEAEAEAEASLPKKAEAEAEASLPKAEAEANFAVAPPLSPPPLPKFLRRAVTPQPPPNCWM